jgi:hypothetical protein
VPTVPGYAAAHGQPDRHPEVTVRDRLPASKQDIVAHAEQNGADKAVIDALKEIEDREYEGPNGVSSAAFS